MVHIISYHIWSFPTDTELNMLHIISYHDLFVPTGHVFLNICDNLLCLFNFKSVKPSYVLVHYDT
jgi:hypothetical protein